MVDSIWFLGCTWTSPSDSRGRRSLIAPSGTDIMPARILRRTDLLIGPPLQEMELDDLFRKTETRPHLYWLPVAKSAAEKSAPAAATANGKA